MNGLRWNLLVRYFCALKERLEDEGEEPLARAYEIGRAALADGFGVVDMASIHHEAVLDLIEHSSSEAERRRIFERAGSFFAECVSPYEMTQRGFKDSVEIARLKAAEALARQRLVEQLRRSYKKEQDLSKVKSRIVSLVSHEFGNAISVIHSALSCLEDGEPRPPKERARVYSILNENVRALHLTATNLLNMGRLENGKFPLHLGPTDMRALLRDAAARLRPLSRRKKLTVELRFADEPALARADAEALALVVTNLLLNAIKRAPAGGRVLVRHGPEPSRTGRTRTSFEDGGSGAEREEVGLSLVREILREHGSTLAFRRRKPARFAFTLPSAGTHIADCTESTVIARTRTI